MTDETRREPAVHRFRISAELRQDWSIGAPVRTVVGQGATPYVLALCSINGDRAVVFPASGVRSRADWWSVEILTPVGGLPGPVELVDRIPVGHRFANQEAATVRIPANLAQALTEPGERTVVIADIDKAVPDALNGLRAALDTDRHLPSPPFHSHAAARRVPAGVKIVLTAEYLSDEVRGALHGRLGCVTPVELA